MKELGLYDSTYTKDVSNKVCQNEIIVKNVIPIRLITPAIDSIFSLYILLLPMEYHKKPLNIEGSMMDWFSCS